MRTEDAFDIAAARRFLQHKEARREQALTKRLERARNDFQRIVDHIVARFRPLRVYQWGSLIDGHHFSEISDIDIAVEGLGGPQQYFAALGDASRMTSFPLDIVEMEAISSEQAARIREKGRLVYERTSS